MANAAVAYLNLFDLATTIATSSAASGTPASNLQNVHVSVKWRGTGGTTDWFEAEWATDQVADTFMVAGLGSTFLATGTVRLELFNSFGVSVVVFGPTAGIVDPSYGYAIHLLGQSYTFRYARWTFVQAGASYIEAGRVFVGMRTTLTYNYAPGASFLWTDLSKETPSAAGGLFIDQRPGYREWDVSFGWVSEAQFLSLVEPMDIANGMRTDVFFIRDPSNTNLGLVSVWGLMRISPTLQECRVDDTTYVYSKAYRLRERRA